MLFQVFAHCLNTTLMDGEQGGFAVWVCPVLHLRVPERSDAHRIFILDDTVPDVRCTDKPFFLLGQLPVLCRVFLQDNEVAAHFRPGMVGKQVVGQPYHRHDISVLHDMPADKLVLRGVQYTLRSDERHDTAFTCRIQTFEEKVVVDALGGGTPGVVRNARIFGIEHRHVAKRNIGCHHIESTHEGFLNPLEPLRTHFMFRVKVREYFSRKQVFVKSHDLRSRSVSTERGDEHPLSCRRIEQAVGDNTLFMERTGNCRYDFGGSVKRCKDGAFQAVHIAFVLSIICRVITDKPV